MKKIADGNTAEIFEYGENLACKLFHFGYPKMYVEHEFENAKLVSHLGISAPNAYKIVRIGERDGIVYDRIIGADFASKLYGASGKEQKKWLEMFVDFHKNLLSHALNHGVDYKDFLRLFAGGSAALHGKIDRLKDGCRLLHGDYHPGNLMVEENGSLVLIDMMNVCKGPAEYDVARTCFLLGEHENQRREYLDCMGYKWEEVQPYYEVISLLRNNEMEL